MKWLPLTCLPFLIVASASRADDVDQLAGHIDHHIEKQWHEASVSPAAPSGDAEFMRRVYLDLGGKIPPVSELRAFLKDPAPDKRRQLVDRLLDSPNYVVNFSNVWRSAMMPEANSDIQVRFLVPGFEQWLRDKLSNNDAYDQVVRELLTTSLEIQNGFNPYASQGKSTPLTFYQAKHLKPENLAAGIARTFLGVRIECAQCHDHPNDSWSRTDFWSFAAFFAGIEPLASGEQLIFGGIRELDDRRELFIPKTDTVVQAAYLDGKSPEWKPRSGARAALADWVTARDNPYFARATVNRLWAHFLGTGIVHPMDDFGAENPPSHPELLDELAVEFVEHDFDLHFLIRAITASRTYQLSSVQTADGQADERLFARATVRGLTSDQLFNSLAQATGYYQAFNVRNNFDFTGASQKAKLQQVFNDDAANSDTPQVGILQALAMMNGTMTADATDIEKSTTLAAVAEFPLATTSSRIETLFLSALSRQPRPDELRRMTEYVDGGGAARDQKQALADVFWVLLNSSEFLFNH